MASAATETDAIPETQAAAEEAGLVYVSDQEPGITRKGAGKGFSYADAKGGKVTDKATLARILHLAIPPAWTDVWISPDPRGHIQATGRDAKGRKQYRYHDRFREIRDSSKYEHMLEFAAALPAIRRRIDEHMALRGLPREKVLATIVRLLETTMIRVGNDDYARDNKSYGLTTLRTRHVDVEGSELRFEFKGKSGKVWRLAVKDRRVAKIVKASQELPGQRLFQYLDETGERQEVTSGDVNAYLKDISGRDITAKDFRTWTGTVLAALALAASEEQPTSETAAKRVIRKAIGQVADALGNTVAVCRKCYVHPAVIESFAEGALELKLGPEKEGALRPEEAAVLKLLRTRLAA